MRFKPAQWQLQRRRVRQPAQHRQQQVEDVAGLVVFFGEAVYQFGSVDSGRRSLQIQTDGLKALDSLGLGHDVEIAATGNQQVAMGERLQMPGHPAGGLGDALRHHAQLAVLQCKQREDGVGLAHTQVLQHHGVGAVHAGNSHVMFLTVCHCHASLPR